MRAYNLEPPILDLVTHSLHWAYCLEAYSVRAYNLEPPILDLVMHSLHWDLQCEGLQCASLQS